MRCITLTQPWATLVAIGAKSIVTRSWRTSWRGPLAIHAAANWKRDERLLCKTYPFAGVLETAGLFTRGRGKGWYSNLPFGAVVATCTLVDCIHITAEDNAANLAAFFAHAAPHDRQFGDYTLGRYMWLLADVVALPEPIPARGALGLWEWTGQP